MPRLSDSMEEGTILKWLKADGDAGSRGEPLAEIETDKATLTYESDAAGMLTIVVAGGRDAADRRVIARLEDGAAARAPAEPAAPPPPRGRGPAGRRAEASAPPEPAARSRHRPGEARPRRLRAAREPAARADGRVKASPIARRMAREQGIDLQLVDGTGPGGRVVRADVEEAATAGTASLPAAPPSRARDGPGRRAPARRARRAQATARRGPRGRSPGATAEAHGDRHRQGRHHDPGAHAHPAGLIARRMAESKATVPEFSFAARSTWRAASSCAPS